MAAGLGQGGGPQTLGNRNFFGGNRKSLEIGDQGKAVARSVFLKAHSGSFVEDGLDRVQL